MCWPSKFLRLVRLYDSITNYFTLQKLDLLYNPSNWPCKLRSHLNSGQVLQDYFDKLKQGKIEMVCSS